MGYYNKYEQYVQILNVEEFLCPSLLNTRGSISLNTVHISGVKPLNAVALRNASTIKARRSEILRMAE